MPDKDLPYQQAAQVRQLLAERENAVAYEQTDRVAAVDKQLEGLGYKSEKQAVKAAGAADERAVAAVAESGGEEAARAKSPEGRHARAKETTEGGRAAK